MGRIDKALSHTSDGPTEIVTVPGAPSADVFESPWSFDGGPSPGAGAGVDARRGAGRTGRAADRWRSSAASTSR